MFKKVLIPLDGSALAEGIIPILHRLLALSDVDVLLVRVVRTLTAEDEPKEALESARAYLDELCFRLRTEGIEARSVVRKGDAAEEILLLAREEGSDLLALSTHGQSGILRLIRGSVAERVLRESTAPILMANPKGVDAHGKDRRAAGFRHVLVPLDGADRSLRIASLVGDLARLWQARVTVLQVTPLHAAGPEEGELLPVIAHLDAQEVDRKLSSAVEKLRAEGVEVDVKTEIGEPTDEILRVIETGDMDLLAISTHGRTGISRWLFGSVAENVLRHCRIPLLLLRVAP